MPEAKRIVEQIYMNQSIARDYLEDSGLSKRKALPQFKRDLLEYEAALARCLNGVEKCLGAETVDLEESLGRVLAEDQVSQVSIPPWPRSMMDGYAVKAADVRDASHEQPVLLDMIDDVPAGHVSWKTVAPGQAIRIMTGACVPSGADAVIKLEQTRALIGNKVEVVEPVGENLYIIPPGQDMAPGAAAARSGSAVTPALMGVLAGCGIRQVRVSRKPWVAIIPTGSELIRPGQPPEAGKIYDINSHALYGLCLFSGAQPVNVGVVKDKASDLLEALQNNLDKDIILLTGGVSVGDYDIVHETLVQAGVREIFWRVKVQPGKPLFFGACGKTLVFGLPGNPVSSTVNFYLFVRPVLDKLSGKSRWGLETATAQVSNSRILIPGRRKFLRGKIRPENGCTYVEVLSEQRSGVFSPMLQADVLIEVPGQVKRLARGDMVKIRLL